MPAKEVTEPTGPWELKTQPVPGNLQEAVLADCRPGPPAKGLPAAGQLEEAQWWGSGDPWASLTDAANQRGEGMGRYR